MTGASSGIGRAIAQRFADDGARVHLTGRRAAELESTASEIGSSVVAAQCDVSMADDLDRLFGTIRADGRRLDTVVANAGMGDPARQESDHRPAGMARAPSSAASPCPSFSLPSSPGEFSCLKPLRLSRATIDRFLSRLAVQDTDGVAEVFAEQIDWFVPGADHLPWTGPRTRREEVPVDFRTVCPPLRRGGERSGDRPHPGGRARRGDLRQLQSRGQVVGTSLQHSGGSAPRRPRGAERPFSPVRGHVRCRPCDAARRRWPRARC
ncbi:SDR family NAD(P)-dependent oxidoreductase [Streptomyces sp. H27-C3]|uniref:SDR family NAD(P)-dependent oxidoreductase n=1 Tax=Streptomyces sp. H27-C3 TaxID=3046305 RepID=UPI0024BA2351|nr:SDR family NAD(P)-dependent oxidoreductase [Streptomyces sp. H27-C3]MDJ0463975.1 SDR family NAD(P)-dependent oxidoreductase [Streptomyces sp. H27-C3]